MDNGDSKYFLLWYHMVVPGILGYPPIIQMFMGCSHGIKPSSEPAGYPPGKPRIWRDPGIGDGSKARNLNDPPALNVSMLFSSFKKLVHGELQLGLLFFGSYMKNIASNSCTWGVARWNHLAMIRRWFPDQARGFGCHLCLPRVHSFFFGFWDDDT